MEVEFQPDIDDYFSAQQYLYHSAVSDSYWRFVPTALGGILGFCLAFGGLAIASFYKDYRHLELQELSLGLGVIAAGFITFVLGSRLYKRAVKPRLFGRNSLYRSPHKVHLADDRMIVTVKNNSFAYDYDDVLKIEEDHRYVYVFIDSAAAMHIPSKTFPSEETKKAFIEKLSNKIGQP
jgi:hypothetical protein